MKALLGGSRDDLLLGLGVMAWIGAILFVDRSGSMAEQVALGVLTWALLLGVLHREAPLVRAQTAVVVVLATAVEYTFSPLLEAYTYRLETVPAYVPPGHGLVYLAALALGRTPLFGRYRRQLVAATLILGGGWALHGVTLAERPDALGAFWFVCLAGFLLWGRSQLLYVGAFVVVTWLEVAGTALGTWVWATHDPVLGIVSQGNPPSGAAGGYGWFDLYALLLAPWVLRGVSRARTSVCRWPLVVRAFPPKGPSSPSSEVNRPPASVTMGTSAAMSCSASSGSQATSTAPSATSTCDQKSP